MKNFMQIMAGLDVLPLLTELQQNPWLWDRQDCRLGKKGPHHETHDIFVRYKDMLPNQITNDWENFGDLHEPVWYPSYYALPSIKPIVFNLMHRLQGEQLGGIFIYTVPPGKKIYAHADPGWHASTFDKYNVCLSSNTRAYFAYPYDNEAMFQAPGDVHRFVNTVPHEVINDGDSDHIVMCVCIKVHNYNTRYRGEELFPFPHVTKMEEPKVDQIFSDGKYYRSLYLKSPGDMVGQHRHAFDHHTHIFSGKARLWKNKIWAGDYKEGSIIETKAGIEHAFQALEPDTGIRCVWPEDIEPESAIVKEKS